MTLHDYFSDKFQREAFMIGMLVSIKYGKREPNEVFIEIADEIETIQTALRLTREALEAAGGLLELSTVDRYQSEVNFDDYTVSMCEYCDEEISNGHSTDCKYALAKQAYQDTLARLAEVTE